jgi:phosphoribosyl-AMP cyclohydrolase
MGRARESGDPGSWVPACAGTTRRENHAAPASGSPAAGEEHLDCARVCLPDEPSPFAERGSIDEIEEGRVLAPKFDADGLVTCVVTDARSGDVLMVAHMNAQALQQTIATGEAWYFSRSRGSLWRKGESSGHAQRVVEMRIDCDQDAVWIRVEQEGPGACHTGRRSCFYRAVPLGKAGAVTLEFRDGERTFDPNAVYGKTK